MKKKTNRIEADSENRQRRYLISSIVIIPSNWGTHIRVHKYVNACAIKCYHKYRLDHCVFIGCL